MSTGRRRSPQSLPRSASRTWRPPSSMCRRTSSRPIRALPLTKAGGNAMSLQDHLQPGEEILYRAHVTRLTLAPLVAWLAVLLAFTIFAYTVWRDYAWVAVLSGLLTLCVAAVLAWRLFRLRSY